jgi:predicted phosphodiesterase
MGVLVARRKRIAVLGDTHFEYAHWPTIYHFYSFIEKEQPDYVVQIGDLKDCFAQSRFSSKIIDPQHEFDAAHTCAKEFWYDVKNYCPKSKLIQILGNHDMRPIRQAVDKCPELLPFLKWEFAFKFKGVQTIYDPRMEFLIDGINFTHGHRKHGTHMLECMNNTVCGHLHKGGVVYTTYRNNLIWELNVGYAGDPTSPALAYPPKAYVNWTHGFGFIDEHGPRFIPWDKKKR